MAKRVLAERTGAAMDDWTRIQKRLDRVERFANWMDDCVAVPGTRIRLGLDSVLGLVPGVGDLGTAVAGLWIVGEAAKLKVPKRVLTRMLINLGVDFAGGLVPVAGDLFDVVWKANRKNSDLLKQCLSERSGNLSSD